MSRKSRAKGKIVRRLGLNIYGNPKYDRLLKKKPAGPGPIKKGRVKVSEYGKQLQEKQKLKFSYGLNEKQLVNLYEKTKKMAGVTGNNILIQLERRLDNVVYRLGMASSRPMARQLVNHGHIQVNGKRVTIPSYLIRATDVITVQSKESSVKLIRAALSQSNIVLPTWVELSRDDLKAEVKRIPAIEEIPQIANIQLIVEFYAK